MNTDGDVKSYDIRFKPCGSEGNYCKETVVAPATSIILTRDSGLKPLTKYKFDVRARSVSQEGKWSELSEYIGMFMHIILYIFIKWTTSQDRYASSVRSCSHHTDTSADSHFIPQLVRTANLVLRLLVCG